MNRVKPSDAHNEKTHDRPPLPLRLDAPASPAGAKAEAAAAARTVAPGRRGSQRRLRRGMSNELIIRLVFFLGIFGLVAVWEAMAPCRRRRPKRWLRWPSNLGIVALNTTLVR